MPLKITYLRNSGLALLVQTGRTAGRHGIGYSVGGASRQLIRVWGIGWPVEELPAHNPGTAAATLAGGHSVRVTATPTRLR